MIPVSIYYRRPIEERVVHALGKAWHVEVIVATRWNILTHFEIISKVLYSSVKEFYWKLSFLNKKSKIFVFHKRIVWIPAFCLCQMWAAIFWNSPLREERAGLLWDSLPSGLFPKWTVCEGSLYDERSWERYFKLLLFSYCTCTCFYQRQCHRNTIQTYGWFIVVEIGWIHQRRSFVKYLLFSSGWGCNYLV